MPNWMSLVTSIEKSIYPGKRGNARKVTGRWPHPLGEATGQRVKPIRRAKQAKRDQIPHCKENSWETQFRRLRKNPGILQQQKQSLKIKKAGKGFATKPVLKVRKPRDPRMQLKKRGWKERCSAERKATTAMTTSLSLRIMTAVIQIIWTKQKRHWRGILQERKQRKVSTQKNPPTLSHAPNVLRSSRCGRNTLTTAKRSIILCRAMCISVTFAARRLQVSTAGRSTEPASTQKTGGLPARSATPPLRGRGTSGRTTSGNTKGG